MRNADCFFSLVAGFAMGSATMYVLDPAGGRRRRALAYDKMTAAGKHLRRTAAVTARDLGNRSAGMLAEMRSRWSSNGHSDRVIEDRVRSKLGFLVRNPSAIKTEVSDGRVVLSGSVLSDEIQQLIDGIRAVRGVTSVENNLTVHELGAHVPELQGGKPRPEGAPLHIMQRNWSPATRFLVATAGAVSVGLLAYALSETPRLTRNPARTRLDPSMKWPRWRRMAPGWR